MRYWLAVVLMLAALSSAAQTETESAPAADAEPTAPQPPPTPAGAASEATEQTQPMAEPEAGRFSGEGGLGLIINSGNTENQSLNGNLKLKYAVNQWTHRFETTVKRVTENETVTAERYLYTEKTDYQFAKHAYWFVAFRYDDDRFSGFDYQASASTGLGWRIYDTEATELDLELGAGYREDQTNDGLIEQETIGRFGGHFMHKMTETSRITQDVLVEGAESNTTTESVTSLKVAINDHLALNATYTWRRNSSPPADREAIDRTTAFNLVYSF